MKLKILIALLAVTAVAGCTIPGVPGIGTGGTTSGSNGHGLEIISFGAEPTPVYNGSTVRVTMDVQNLGGTTAFDKTSWAYLTGSNIDITGGDNTYWHRISGDTTTTQCMSFGRDMRPADVVKGTSGDEKTIKWSLRAPDITSGQTRTDSFIGRVYSEYETSVNGNIWVYNETEYDAAKASGRALSKSSFTSTPGPVAVDVSVSPDPVVLYSGDLSFSMTITISNLQTGTIYKTGLSTNCPPSIGSDDLNKVSVTVTAKDFSIAGDCQLSGSTTTEQELVSGKTTTMICDMTSPSVTTLKSYPVTVTVNYGYYTEETVNVLVQGK